MKRRCFVAIAVMITLFMTGACELETNYSDKGHYGNVIIHNEADSGGTISHIAININTGYSDWTYYDENVTITPGNSSATYKIEMEDGMGLRWNNYKVTVTVGSNTIKGYINVYDDIVNHLYYNGTTLEEKK